MAEMVLFLDFDGVLNKHEWCHLGSSVPRIGQPQADVLRCVLLKLPVSIIISSTWGRHLSGDVTTSGFSWMLKTHGIDANVIGGYDGSVNAVERSEQILRFCRDNGISAWVAVDDMPLTVGASRHVQPHPSFGLEPRHASEIVDKLRAMA